MYKTFKNERWEYFKHFELKKEIEIKKVPKHLVDKKLRVELAQKFKRHIVHSRDFELNKKRIDLNLPTIIKDIKDEEIRQKKEGNKIKQMKGKLRTVEKKKSIFDTL